MSLILCVFIVGVIAGVITIVVMALIRAHIRKECERLVVEILNLPPYRRASSEQPGGSSGGKLDVNALISDNYGESIVKLAELQNITTYYSPTLRKAQNLCL